jgi:hypothetical protein
MDQFLKMVQPLLQQAMGSTLGSLLVFAAVFLLVLLLVVPLYFILGQRGSGTGDRRAQLLQNLNTAERGLSRFYAVLLCFIMAAVTGLAVFFYLKIPDDGNRDFLLMYGGVVYLVAMAWAASQLFSVMRRLSPPPNMPSGMGSNFSNFTLSFQTSPQVQFIDNQALDRAQQHLDSGGSLEEACALMDPKYRSMNSMMQSVFRKAMEVALEQRRKSPS